MALSEAEGDKLWKSAHKLTNPSFLSMRLKGDWEQAGPLYEKAALNYKHAKKWDKARESLEMAAKCAQRQSSPWHAGKHFEKAAECAKEMQAWNLVVDLYKEAALAYREAGRAQLAADALSKGAKIMEDRDPKAACEILAEAIDEVESEGKFTLAGDLYRQAIGSLIRTQQWPEAVQMLLRFAAACDECKASASQCKAYLGAVVVWLFANNGKQAWAVHQDALEVDVFGHSEEAFAAEALLEAYRSGDADEVQRCVASRATFRDLDNQVARLAKKLPQGPVGEVAAALGGGGGAPSPSRVTADDLDEDDLT